jgi:hypothetical protein
MTERKKDHPKNLAKFQQNLFFIEEEIKQPEQMKIDLHLNV